MKALREFHGLLVREDLWRDDTEIVNEVLVKDGYRARELPTSEGGLVIDAGAHIGAFASLWHAHDPSAKIICIEACPENIPLLRRNVGNFAEIIEAALTYEPGSVVLLNTVRSGANSGRSIVVPADKVNHDRHAHGDAYVPDDRPLAKITLEQIAGERDCDRIHLLKLDIERSEFSVWEHSWLAGRTRFMVGTCRDIPRMDSLLDPTPALRSIAHTALGDLGRLRRFRLVNKVWPPCPRGEASARVAPLMPPGWRTHFEQHRDFYDLCVRWLKGRKTFVEVGVQIGANSLALLLSDKLRTGIGIDNDADVHARGAVDFAERITDEQAPGRFRLIRANSRQLPAFPSAEAVVVDGDHSYDGCLADLRTAAASGADLIVADDHNNRGVLLAVDEFLGLERAWDRCELARLCDGRLTARLVRRRPGEPYTRVAQPNYVPTVCVPSGIGDALWALSKMRDWLTVRGLAAKDAVDVILCGGAPYRALELIERLDFVRRASYSDLRVTEADYTAPDGSYNYAPSQPDWHGRHCWLLQANKHLEQGGRLEDWFPHYRTDWTMLERYRRDEAADAFAADLAARLGRYAVLFAGSLGGNTTWGHNRNALWQPGQWRELADGFRKEGLRIVWVGAEYDRSYFEHLGMDVADVDGVGKWPLLQTLVVIDHATCMVAYQSGLAVYAAWRGVPCGMFWRPYGDSIDPSAFVSFRETMASGWVQRKAVAEGNYLPLIYTRCSPVRSSPTPRNIGSKPSGAGMKSFLEKSTKEGLRFGSVFST